MRALMIALALASVGGAAVAQQSTTMSGADDAVRHEVDMAPKVPKGAVGIAETAVRRDLPDPDGVTFKGVKSKSVASIRHGVFGDPIDGPVFVVCGEYASRNSKGVYGDYTWFFAAIKHDKVLWTADENSGGPSEAYASCRGAGLGDAHVNPTISSNDGR